jgi:hypothetical protein
MYQADAWDDHEQGTCELAWQIVGHPELIRRAMAAAEAQREIAKKNG